MRHSMGVRCNRPGGFTIRAADFEPLKRGPRNTTRLTKDQKGWIKMWGDLRHYATPKQRRQLMAQVAARHAMEARK